MVPQNQGKENWMLSARAVNREMVSVGQKIQEWSCQVKKNKSGPAKLRNRGMVLPG